MAGLLKKGIEIKKELPPIKTAKIQGVLLSTTIRKIISQVDKQKVGEFLLKNRRVFVYKSIKLLLR